MSHSPMVSGESLQLTCAAPGESNVIYKFMHNSDVIESSAQDTYIIHTLTTTDSGNYSCSVNINGEDQDKSNDIEINVIGKSKSGSFES